MESPFKFSTMMLGKSLILILITPMIVRPPKTEARVKLLFLCICTYYTIGINSLWIHAIYGDQIGINVFHGGCYFLVRMSNKVAKLYSLWRQQRAAHQMEAQKRVYLEAQRRVYLLNQRWEMHYFSGAWSLTDPEIPKACTVSLLILIHALLFDS